MNERKVPKPFNILHPRNIHSHNMCVFRQGMAWSALEGYDKSESEAINEN